MSTPADKAIIREAAATLISLVDRAERAEARVKELEQSLVRTIDSGEALCRLLNPHNLPAGAEQQLEATIEQFRRASDHIGS